MEIEKLKKQINFIQIRRDICNSCEHLKTFVGIESCDVCGCAIWAKTRIKSASCPKGKWNAQED